MRTVDFDTNVNARFSKAEKQRLSTLASRQGVSISELVRRQVRKLIEQAA